MTESAIDGADDLVESVHFSSVFRGLASQRLPDFVNLLGMKAPETGHAVELRGTQRAEAIAELRAIHEICKTHGYRPLLSELAVISDVRLHYSLEKPEKPDWYFSSVISSFVSPSRGLASVYVDALRFMATTEREGGVQIVPHPDLYAHDVALIKVSLGNYFDRDVQDEDDVAIDREVQTCHLIRHEFTLERPNLKFGIKQQIHNFLSKFCAYLNLDKELSQVCSLFRDSHMLIVPFVRPMFESAALILDDEMQEHYRGYPGGVLFLVIRDEESQGDQHSRMLDLTRSVLLLLAESGIRESYVNFQVEERRNRSYIAYEITHPLKHRLGTLHRLIEILTETDRKDDKFSKLFDLLERSVNKTYKFTELVHLLYFASTMGRRSPFKAKSEAGRLKYCTQDSLDVVALVNKVLNELPVGDSGPPAVRCEPGLSVILRPFAPGSTESHRVRLKDLFYEAVIQEILINVISHGSMDRGAEVKLERCQLEEGAAFAISNVVEADRARRVLAWSNGKWKAWGSLAPSGLRFATDALERTGSGKLYYRCKQISTESCLFSVALTLEGLEPVLPPR